MVLKLVHTPELLGVGVCLQSTPDPGPWPDARLGLSEDRVWTRPCLQAPSASTPPAFRPCGSLDNLQAFLLLLSFFIPFIHLEVADKIRQASF